MFVDQHFSLATEIHQSVKRSIQSCCQQLRSHLMKRNALKDAKTRRSKLVKYVPDISRSLYGLLDGMRQRHMEEGLESQHPIAPKSPSKRLKLDPAKASQIIQMLNTNQITEDVIHGALMESIETAEASTTDDNIQGTETRQSTVPVVAPPLPPIPLYIVPLYNFDDARHDVCHPKFTFRPIVPLPIVPDV